MTRSTALLFGVLACMTLPCVAGAQNPQPAAPQDAHPTVAPPNAPNPPPEQIAPADRAPGATGDTSLSNKLSRSQGTLRPPAVDPGINVPVPAQSQGTMPVIPPPGSPGGDQKIVPK
jgi:hypothetical protein